MTPFSKAVSSSHARTCIADRDVISQIKFWAFCATLVGSAFSNSLASAGTVAYLLALIAGFFLKKTPLPKYPFLGLGALLCASILVSTAMSAYPADSRQGLLKYAWSFILLYAGIDALRTLRQLRAALIVLFVCQAAAALSGIGQDLWGWDWIRGRAPVLYTDAITRVTGPFKHCNDFATFLISGIVLGVAVFFDRLRVRRPAQAAVVAVFLALVGWVMFRTMSRSAMMGATAGLILLAFALPHRKWILGVIGAALAAAWWVPSPFADRLHRLFDFHDGAMQERLYLIKGSLKMIHAAPWFGLGVNTYSKWFPIYNPPDAANPVVMYAHNSFLQMATEIGWVGLALYLIFLGAQLARAARPVIEKQNDGLDLIRAGMLASMSGMLVNALFESLLQSTQLRTLFWCFMGLSAALASRDWKIKSTAQQ